MTIITLFWRLVLKPSPKQSCPPVLLVGDHLHTLFWPFEFKLSPKQSCPQVLLVGDHHHTLLWPLLFKSSPKEFCPQLWQPHSWGLHEVDNLQLQVWRGES